MKKTSYETSKKLAEAGFKAETDFYWAKWNQGEPELLHEKEQTPNLIEQVPAYDLETILEALPAYIEHINTEYHFWLWNDGMGYYPNYDKYSGEGVYDMDNGILEFSENESLADTAARLLLLLHEKNLIKF